MDDDWLSEDMFRGQPLRLMPLEDVEAELERVWRRCGTTRMPRPRPDDAEWKRILTDLLPSAAREYGTRKWVAAHSERERAALGYTASNLWNLVRHMRTRDDPRPPPRWVLLPHRWQPRMHLCLGMGALPFAWIAQMEPA